MNRLNTSAARIAYLFEATEGVLPLNPSWKILRVTGETLLPAYEDTKSKELNANRNVRDQIRVGVSGTGGLTFEFSDGTFDDILQAALFGEWDVNDDLVNGVKQNPLAFEVTNLGETVADHLFKRFGGGYLADFELQIKAGEVVTGSANMMARTAGFDTAAVAGASYTDPNDEPALSAADVGSVTVSGGATLDCVMSLSMKIGNNLRPQRCVGSLNATGVGYGDFDMEGELEFYMSRDQYSFLTAVADNTPLSLEWVLGTEANKKTLFSLPKIKLGTPTITNQSQNQDLMCKVPFRALEDGTGKTVLITRDVA